MAEKKTSFPMMPLAHWWSLRRRFKQSIPGVVTSTYIASALNMQEASARANVLPYLQIFGLIDAEGRTLERARQWRDDHMYADVCKEIRGEIYPQELLDVAPDPATDSKPAARWFGNHTGGGEVAVRKMVSVYTLLMMADPNDEPVAKTTEKSGGRQMRPTSRSKQIPKNPPGAKPVIEAAPHETSPVRSNTPAKDNLPEININLQVHISSDATPDQIDKIFESMAKHLYRRD